MGKPHHQSQSTPKDSGGHRSRDQYWSPPLPMLGSQQFQRDGYTLPVQ
jgi:hypothetical protein